MRVGDTIRKSWLPTTPHVVDYLQAMHGAGIDLPCTHGRDEHGRLVLDFIPGTMAIEVAPLPDAVVYRVGALIRSMHDASAPLGVPDGWPDGVLPAPERELICHNDLATWNLVIDGHRLVFIDWDGAAPSSRAWDLAYAAISFAHLFPDADVPESAGRLRALLAGYAPDDQLREALPQVLAERSRAMYLLLRDSHFIGREPWASMFVDGHGELWNETTHFIARHAEAWTEAIANRHK